MIQRPNREAESRPSAPMGKRAKPSPFAPLERDVEPPLRKLSFVRARYASASARVSPELPRHSRVREAPTALAVPRVTPPTTAPARRHFPNRDRSRPTRALTSAVPRLSPSPSRLPASATAGARTRPWFPRRRRGA